MILKPLQFIYEFGSDFKNKLYDRNFIKKIKLNVPVVSIGNLSVGGTGKTPCVFLLAQEFIKLSQYKKIVIVSRSYKASLKFPQKVDLSNKSAVLTFGDEPCLLQSLLPQCSVWSGPVKYLTAQAAEIAEKPDLILIDDGFSHRKLIRNFDIVLIDATAPMNYFQSLPVGRLRESLDQLSRADAILITRANLVDINKVEKIKQLILKNNSKLKELIFESSSVTVLPDSVNKQDQLFVFCGLGHPKSFKSSLEALNYELLVFKEFQDHYMYKKSDLDQIFEDFKTLKSTHLNLKLVTTEKDLIKIKNHPILDFIHTAKNLIEINDNKKDVLIEKICQHL
ncbi:MAG: tetraacyldisaccharide 4'-kinase [Pseudobdellovibrio sp.]